MDEPKFDLPTEIANVIEFRASLDHETDRGAALMSAAYLDDQLGRLLDAVFVEHQKVRTEFLAPNGPVGSFSSRIDLAYLLGQIPELAWRDLHLIRKIRNDFAHVASPLTFEEKSIADRCRGLFHSWQSDALPRQRFTAASTAVLAFIHKATHTSSRPTPPAGIAPEKKQLVDEDVIKMADAMEAAFAVLEKRRGEASSQG